MLGLGRARIGAGVAVLAALAFFISACGSSGSSSSGSGSGSSGSGTSTSGGGTGSGSGSGSKPLRIAIFYYNPSPYGVASLNGAKEEAKKLGVQLDAFDGNNNPQTQSKQVQDAITSQKYQGFWMWGLDDPSLTPIVQQAESAGIKVACADYTWGTLAQQAKLTASPLCATTVGQAVGTEATNLEKTMNAACVKQVGASGHCNIAFLPGLDNYPSDTVRVNAMTAYYKSKPNYTFTVMPPGQYDQTASQKVAQTYFSANKNVNVFATFGDQMAAGTMTALNLVGGYTPGKNIAVIGYGGAKELISEVKSGTVYATLGLYPVAESVLGMQYLVDVLKGKSVPKVVNIINPDTRPAVIDGAFLQAHPNYVPDWTLSGGIG